MARALSPRGVSCLRAAGLYDVARANDTENNEAIALKNSVQRRCYNIRHADLGSFRVDDNFVFTSVYPLLRLVALGPAVSCGLISAANCWHRWAAFGISTNSGESVSREEKVAVVEAYLRGLAGKDISKIPFAANITFEGPRVGKLIGRNAVVGFLTSILPAVKSVQIKQHIVEAIACMSATVN
jgi:hypothetical protein